MLRNQSRFLGENPEHNVAFRTATEDDLLGRTIGSPHNLNSVGRVRDRDIFGENVLRFLFLHWVDMQTVRWRAKRSVPDDPLHIGCNFL